MAAQHQPPPANHDAQSTLKVSASPPAAACCACFPSCNKSALFEILSGFYGSAAASADCHQRSVDCSPRSSQAGSTPAPPAAATAATAHLQTTRRIRTWGAAAPHFHTFSFGAYPLGTSRRTRPPTGATGRATTSRSAFGSLSLIKGSFSVIAGGFSQDEGTDEGGNAEDDDVDSAATLSADRAAAPSASWWPPVVWRRPDRVAPASTALLPPLVLRDPRWLLAVAFLAGTLAMLAATMILVNDGIVVTYFVPPQQQERTRRARRRAARAPDTIPDIRTAGQQQPSRRRRAAALAAAVASVAWVGRLGSASLSGSRRWRLGAGRPSPAGGQASTSLSPRGLRPRLRSRAASASSSPMLAPDASSRPSHGSPSSEDGARRSRPPSALPTPLQRPSHPPRMPASPLSPTLGVLHPQSMSPMLRTARILSPSASPLAALGVVELQQRSGTEDDQRMALGPSATEDVNLPASAFNEPSNLAAGLSMVQSPTWFVSLPDSDDGSEGEGLSRIRAYSDGPLSPLFLGAAGWDTESESDESGRYENSDVESFDDEQMRQGVLLDDGVMMPSIDSDADAEDEDDNDDGFDRAFATSRQTFGPSFEIGDSFEVQGTPGVERFGLGLLETQGLHSWNSASSESLLRRRRRRLGSGSREVSPARSDSSDEIADVGGDGTTEQAPTFQAGLWRGGRRTRLRRLRESAPGALAAVGAVLLLAVLWFLRRRGWYLLPRLWQLAARRWGMD
ncbi:hypothetical protein HK405_001911 [Cladochytrium tenue]|nr:hypothetical protein HK405_001911 [Cladochytrium tenue]